MYDRASVTIPAKLVPLTSEQERIHILESARRARLTTAQRTETFDVSADVLRHVVSGVLAQIPVIGRGIVYQIDESV